uniref:Uncharacterized protein LOC111114562 n=1 Tax=Crassostrea virginica TaxID=6565 RepID=A0A8B8BZ09_CRAVI|nr:uncharacterized protein LOC111114562 [Crassostrea virginica]
MLERYKDSLSDLVHLLKVDLKNSAAQREEDIVNDYWRKELKSQPAQSPTSKAKPALASEKKTPANEKSAQQTSNISTINVSKSVQPEPSKTEEMSTSKKENRKLGRELL